MCVCVGGGGAGGGAPWSLPDENSFKKKKSCLKEGGLLGHIQKCSESKTFVLKKVGLLGYL